MKASSIAIFQKQQIRLMKNIIRLYFVFHKKWHTVFTMSLIKHKYNKMRMVV